MSSEVEYVAFYGTLMKGQHTAIHKRLDSKLKFKGKCLIPGQIYDMGRYPALKLDNKASFVHGELYEIVDADSLKQLDHYEAHDNDDPGLPGFTRRLVELESPKRLAWVYEYDGPVTQELLINTNDWRTKL